jgi:hypothetical protein
MGITINAVNYIRNIAIIEHIDNTVNCYINNNPLTLESLQEYITNKDLRRQMLETGYEDGVGFLAGRK